MSWADWTQGPYYYCTYTTNQHHSGVGCVAGHMYNGNAQTMYKEFDLVGTIKKAFLELWVYLNAAQKSVSVWAGPGTGGSGGSTNCSLAPEKAYFNSYEQVLTPTLALNTWHKVQCTTEESGGVRTTYGYVNDRLVFSNAVSGTLSIVTKGRVSITFGGTNSTTDWYADDVRVLLG